MKAIIDEVLQTRLKDVTVYSDTFVLKESKAISDLIKFKVKGLVVRCVCMYVCMYIGTYACTYIGMFVRSFDCLQKC